MDKHARDRAHLAWRHQELARFGQRAHAQLGRGFVLVEHDEERPIYVTQLSDAPLPLFDAVCQYNPEEETLVVSDEDEPETFTIRVVKIQKPN
jgi:hypothetical protein